ncbi:RDD family protein [uncultured Clostridium sp.]|uniref:RDD family protein n=1 Tax=uncultured Clostridium sp. TaxID=59620 RepID=UPI0028E1F317|nr:RDD family protein [uncultured Clostridium sp.]
MEKDNVKENETNSDMEETEVQASDAENTEEVTNDTEEAAVTVSEEIENSTSEEVNRKSAASGVILANILDQLLIVVCSSLLVFLCNLVLKLFGYMFIQGNGSIILAGGIIYFILNCIYAPIMEKTKLRTTIAKKILNI